MRRASSALFRLWRQMVTQYLADRTLQPDRPTTHRLGVRGAAQARES